MRWEGRRQSTNIEDRRGMRFGRAGGIGLGTIVLALVWFISIVALGLVTKFTGLV